MTFTIDADSNITALASSQQIEQREEGTETFSSPHELAALAAQWPGARLVEIWNSLPGGTGRAVHQPAGGRYSDLEGHSARAAHCWRTEAAGGAEEDQCEEQGQPPRPTRQPGKHQDGEGDRAVATARGGHAPGHHARDRMANPPVQ